MRTLQIAIPCLLSGALLVVVPGGCKKDSDAGTASEKTVTPPATPAPMPTPTPTPAPAAPEAAAPAATMNDGQVLGVLAAANQGEIDFSQMGVKKAKDPAVKKFAEMMVKHHTEGLAKVKKTVTDTKMTADATNEVVQKLDTSVKDEKAKLESGGDAKAFDLQFMCAQVRMHTDVLKTIDEKLLPGAQDEKVKADVTATKPIVASHLDEAKGIVQKLARQPADVACK